MSWALYFLCYDRLKDALRYYRSSSDGGELAFYDYFVASGTAGGFFFLAVTWSLLFSVSALFFRENGREREDRARTQNQGADVDAGILTSLATNPIWVIKTRMLSTSAKHPGAYASMSEGARQIYRTEGVSGFYRGLVPSLFGVTHGALQFMAYERLKNARLRRSSETQQDLGSVDVLVLSGLAKMFAGSATYPYQVVRARLQMYEVDRIYSGARDVVRQVWKKEGLAGFYKGLGPNLFRVLPSTCVTFLVYERTKQYLNRSPDGQKADTKG